MKKILLLCAVLVQGTLWSQSLNLTKHQVSISGTSSLHDWESKVSKATGGGSVTLSGTQITAVSDLHLSIPVKSIQSGKDVMDSKTYEAFNEPKNPTITFKANKAAIQGNKMTLDGQMTMNGKTVPTKVTLTYTVSGKDINLVGTKIIDMTDFGMTPPKAVMGTIKVGPKVTVLFDVTYTL
jgi:polyisoprenoid-binding protein YceI